MNATRQMLATAQVLPALTRKMVAEAPTSDAQTEKAARAAELTRASYPMYEGYMSFGTLYQNNLGILGMRQVEIGEE